MKTTKNLNLINSMNTQTILKNLFKFSLGLSLISPLFKNKPVQAFTTPCPETNSVANLNGQANPCFITPEMLKVTFYEIGFCTADPLATGTFVNTTCSKSWDNTSGFETDIGKKTFTNMVGKTYKVPNATYGHAYAIMNNEWTYKAEYKLSGGNTYHTNTLNGLASINPALQGEWKDDISNMAGQETTGNCFDFEAATTGGTVKAVLANSSLVTATNTTTCNNATRVVGSVALTTAVTMDDSVKGYKLSWQITDMGIGLTHGGNPSLPFDWRGGPFTPIFTLIK